MTFSKYLVSNFELFIPSRTYTIFHILYTLCGIDNSHIRFYWQTFIQPAEYLYQ